jgi:predicted transglutaminase-like cysteine proteinase
MRKVFAGLLVVLFFPGSEISAKSQAAEPFSMVAFELSEGRMWNVLRSIRSEIQAQLPRQQRCLADLAHCNAADRLLRDVVTEAAAKGGLARIETANARINAAIRYRSDEERWNVADAWSVALTLNQVSSLDSGVGDCVDYSIAKYVTLRLAGVADATLRVVLVRDNAVRKDHAVLAVRDGARWFILDNRWNGILEPRDLERRFKPLAAIDANRVSLLARPFRIRDYLLGETAAIGRAIKRQHRRG